MKISQKYEQTLFLKVIIIFNQFSHNTTSNDKGTKRYLALQSEFITTFMSTRHKKLFTYIDISGGADIRDGFR